MNFDANGFARIVDKGDATSGFAFYVRESTRGIAYLIYGGNFIGSNSDVIDLAQWQYVAVTYSNTSRTLAFYVNGKPADGDENYQTNPNDSANAPLIIGNRAATNPTSSPLSVPCPENSIKPCDLRDYCYNSTSSNGPCEYPGKTAVM